MERHSHVDHICILELHLKFCITLPTTMEDYYPSRDEHNHYTIISYK